MQGGSASCAGWSRRWRANSSNASGKTEFELVSDYALPLPVEIICRLLNIPSADCTELARRRAASFRHSGGSQAFNSVLSGDNQRQRQPCAVD
ncbi:hypothetical protein CIC12_26995 [Burkholderia sp. SG-MS1]|nr:hypothetical protein [Paraburkholderia sp. SG-MS1]